MPKLKPFDKLIEDMFDEEMFKKTFIRKNNPYESVNPIPTGSFSLDLSIGIGGIPKRRFTVIDGLESCGKTTVAFSVARNTIEKLNERVLYVETENQMDYDYAQILIGNPAYFDEGRIILAKPRTSDDAFNIIEAGIRSKEFGLIVLDSVAGLAPEEEVDADFEKANMMVIPRDIAHFFRRNVFDVRTNNVAVLFVNQLRDNVGAYVKSYQSVGGHALKYYASLMINLSRESDIKAGEEKVGILTKFVIKKNKLSAPYRTFHFPIMFGKGIDSGRDIITFAETIGVIKKAGPYYKFEDIALGRGIMSATSFIAENPGVLDKITQMCYNMLGKSFVENPDEIGEEDES